MGGEVRFSKEVGRLELRVGLWFAFRVCVWVRVRVRVKWG